MSTRFRAAALVAVLSLGATAAHAEPGGCLKYGAVGAVGGHFVGKGHAVLGAVGGCAAGMWKRHQFRKEQAQLAKEGLEARKAAAAQHAAYGQPGV